MQQLWPLHAPTDGIYPQTGLLSVEETNIQELEKNNVFADGAYWAVMSAGGAYHYILSVVSGKINAYAHSDQAANLRCVHE